VLRPLAAAAVVVLAGSLAGCSPAVTGHVALAVDPAGRLIAVTAVCPGEHLGWLTLADETTGARTTVVPPTQPAFGGALLLTGPVGDPHPEGLLDLLDRDHEYTLDGGTAKPDSTDSTGRVAGVRFRLGAALAEPKLRQGYVLTAGEHGADIVKRADFVANAKRDC
jgi:hypothetical protein